MRRIYYEFPSLFIVQQVPQLVFMGLEVTDFSLLVIYYCDLFLCFFKELILPKENQYMYSQFFIILKTSDFKTIIGHPSMPMISNLM